MLLHKTPADTFLISEVAWVKCGVCVYVCSHVYEVCVCGLQLV